MTVLEPTLDRDVVFVLGAGASAPDGVPLQRDLLPYIAGSSDKNLVKSWMGTGLREFLDVWFETEVAAGLYPGLEEVFGFIDYHLKSGEALGEDWGPQRLELVRRALIVCLHHAVHVAGLNPPSTYGAFWSRIGRVNSNVGVVSLNYDALLESAFDPLYPSIALIDYCCHLMNYDDPPNIPGYWWWVDPRGAIVTPGEQLPKSIKIIKVHGSLNWKYCPTCRGLLVTPWDTAIDLDDGIFHWTEGPGCDLPETRHELRCPYDGTHFETLIAPPSHAKRFDHPILSLMISEAIRELRRARRVVVIGYSFPEADVYLRSVFARAVHGAEVTIVDPGLSDHAKARFGSVFREPRFLRMGFAEFIQSGELEATLDGTAVHTESAVR